MVGMMKTLMQGDLSFGVWQVNMNSLDCDLIREDDILSTNGCTQRTIWFHRVGGETVDWLRDMIEVQNNLDVKSSFNHVLY